MSDVRSSADSTPAGPPKAPVSSGAGPAGERERLREYAVEQFVRRLQDARYTAAGRDGWWWPRWRDARAVSRLQRAAARLARFEGAPQEAYLRFMKSELMVHAVTDLEAGPDAMKARMDGICTASTLGELRDFIRASNGRPDWDFTQ